MTGTINVSTKTKILVISIFIILFLAIITLIGTIIAVNSINKSNIENYKTDIYLKTQTELQNYVQVTIQTIESFYQRTSKDMIKQEVQEHLTEQMGLLFSILEDTYNNHKNIMNKQQLKQHLLKTIKASRYGENGYFWVNDFKGVMLMHPIQKELTNKNLIKMKDEAGKELFKAFIHTATLDKQGFVDYLWPKPGFDKAQDKISFIKVFEPFNWIIGTGDYIDDVTKKLQDEALKTISQIKYANNGYFWINTSEPKMVMHPIFKELNGKNLSEFKDKEGQKIFLEFATLANEKKEGGLVLYSWPKPGETEPKPKFSYVKKFEPWDWIVGTGAYIDDVETKIKNMEEKSQKSLQIITIISAIIFVIVLIILSLITLALSSKRDNKNFADEY